MNADLGIIAGDDRATAQLWPDQQTPSGGRVRPGSQVVLGWALMVVLCGPVLCSWATKTDTARGGPLGHAVVQRTPRVVVL